MKYHVFNLDLKSHDEFSSQTEAEELILQFLKDGYILSQLYILKGELFDINIGLETREVPK